MNVLSTEAKKAFLSQLQLMDCHFKQWQTQLCYKMSTTDFEWFLSFISVILGKGCKVLCTHTQDKVNIVL